MPRSTMRSTRVDFIVLLLIGVLGALQFFLRCRAADYLFDTNYFELARSIAGHGGYGFNGKPMTQLPPGLPYLAAWLGLTTSSSYSVVVGVMTVFAALALMLSYRLLSVQEGRGAAAAACLLLGSSPFLFEFSTRMVFTDLPYWFASMLLIYAALKLDALGKWRPLMVVLWVAWGVGLIATILVRSAAVALLGGLCGWIVLTYLRDRKLGSRRLRLFMPAIIMALAAQGSWMWWAHKHQFHEWSVPGYQENYLAQLRLKNANDPDLGVASWKDVIARPIENSDDIGSAMFGLFAHKDMAPAWYSPGSVLPALLMGLGLVYSFVEGNVLAWYFVCYAGMFLFWSWNFETRFLLPVAPLAFLYAWRGWKLVVRMAQSRRRLIGLAGFVLALAGCLSSIVWGRAVLHPQMRWCVAMWVPVGMISLGLFWSGGTLIQGLVLALRRPLFKGRSVTGWQAIGAAVVGCGVIGGVLLQIPIGLANLNSDVAKFSSYPDIEAAEWISAHSAQSSVIMARKDDIVYHYSRHRVIWFPASRDAALLMDGIRRYHVEYVVVRHGDDTYWQPTAEECFAALARTYPSSFRLVHTGPQNSVFEVVRGAMTSSRSVGARG